jgi:hypothetical protein
MAPSARASDLLHKLIALGLVPGATPVAVDQAAGMIALRLPVVYCQGAGCGSQLVTHWFVTGDLHTSPVFLCIWCAQNTEAHEPGTVRALIEGQESWLTDARCRCHPDPSGLDFGQIARDLTGGASR